MTESRFGKIAVVGAGALGSYFGGLLARAGFDVTLIGRKLHVDAINRDGLALQHVGVDERIKLKAVTDMAAVAGARLILFCVKSLDTETAARELAPHIAPEAVILNYQNGVDNLERIRRHLPNEIIPVLVYVGANIPAPGSVRHTGGRHIIVGRSREFRGRRPDALPDIAAALTRAGVEVKTSNDIEADLWTKLVMNCAYNAICALGDAPYGRMVAMSEVAEVMREAVDEVVAVAKVKGIDLAPDIADAAIKLADTMPETRSSTAQDLARGRHTEIDHLNGYIVAEGEQLGIATPVNRTLHALMKLLEQSRLK
jgi:2-dehydropantoate 2-reductase